MTTPIEELKIRARLLRNALARSDVAAVARAMEIARRRRWDIPKAWTLSHCLNIVSVETGFAQWEHARRVLSGEARLGDDMGTLWYDKGCAAMVNHWFGSYDEARVRTQEETASFLLPYARQFIVVEAPFIDLLGVSPALPHWNEIERDLVAGYGKPGWHALVLARLLRIH